MSMQLKDEVVKEKKSSSQCCSKEMTGTKKRVEKEQDKLGKNADREIVEHESPEVHGEADPRF